MSVPSPQSGAPPRFVAPADLVRMVRAEADHLVLCLDYDGTIVDFHTDVRHTETPPEVARLMARLAADPRHTVAIVTGRATDDLAGRLAVDGLITACEHGKDIRGPGIERAFEPEPDVQAAISTIHARWLVLAERQPGCYMQRKRFSATFSTRRAPRELWDSFAEAARACGAEEAAAGLVRFTAGQGLVELRPRGGWTKGTATRIIAAHARERHPGRRVLVVFMGDDLTDEDALAELHFCAPAIGVRVTSDPRVETSASVLLEGIGQVLETLSLLVGDREGSAAAAPHRG